MRTSGLKCTKKKGGGAETGKGQQTRSISSMLGKIEMSDISRMCSSAEKNEVKNGGRKKNDVLGYTHTQTICYFLGEHGAITENTCPRCYPVGLLRLH